MNDPNLDRTIDLVGKLISLWPGQIGKAEADALKALVGLDLAGVRTLRDVCQTVLDQCDDKPD